MCHLVRIIIDEIDTSEVRMQGNEAEDEYCQVMSAARAICI